MDLDWIGEQFAAGMHDNEDPFALYAPCWDPWTRCVFAIARYGNAVLRINDENKAEVVAGSWHEEGVANGPGSRARFDGPFSLTSDGAGCLYVSTESRICKMQLPAAWRAREDGVPGGQRQAARQEPANVPPDRPNLDGDPQPQLQPQEQQLNQQQQHHAQPQDQGNEGAEVQVSTLPCEAIHGQRLKGIAYDPTTHSLIISTITGLYRRSLNIEALQQPHLLADGSALRQGAVAGAGERLARLRTRFECATGLAVDADGNTYFASDDNAGAGQHTSVRRLSHDGTLTTLVTGLRRGLKHPAILPNGCLGLCEEQPGKVVVIYLGLKPNACHAAATPPSPSPQATGPPPYSLASDLGALLDRQPDGSADVAVEVGGQVFHTHRGVLAARSPYFRQRLLEGFAECGAQQLSLPDADPAAFALVLRYMYTDSGGAIPAGMLLSVGELADRLLLPGLCEEVGGQLLEGVSAVTVVELILWAERRSVGFAPLLQGLEAWFGEHGAEVAQQAPDSIKRLMVTNPELAFSLHWGAQGTPAKRRRTR